jgi:hypothetical protein
MQPVFCSINVTGSSSLALVFCEKLCELILCLSAIKTVLTILMMNLLG